MNDLSTRLLEAAYQDLPRQKRTSDSLQAKVDSMWVVWRNRLIDDWAERILPTVQRRPASDYYPEAELGHACLHWLNTHNFHNWEIPIYDGEDDDFVYHFIAYWLAIMTWKAFEPLWGLLDCTTEEVTQFFNSKNIKQLTLF